MAQFSRVGQVIGGRYKLVAPVGAGNMGAVYVAQEDGGPYIAVKLVLDVEEGYQARDRFVREVSTLNRIEHRNIVELIDFGYEDDTNTPYFAMELVMGDALSRFPSRGRMSPEFVVHVAREVCLGLAAAHYEKVVHRDLKPGNIMVYPKDGGVGVKILDFGLAFDRNAETKLTRTGTMPGTVSYMAPESLKGETVDARADIYGLGCIMYELLTAKMPFPGENTTKVGMAQLTQKPPKARKAVKSTPKELEALIIRFLSKDPAGRPETAGQAAEELAELADKLGLVSPTTSHEGPSKTPVEHWGIIPV